MAYEVVFSKKAKRDLREALNYCIEKYDNILAADGIYQDFQDTTTRLREMADKLMVREDLDFENCRAIRFKKHKYIMIYEVVGKKVYVYRIYHTSRDIKNALKKSYRY